MSQTIGMVADVDIETERIRWMGDFRFILGYICASQSLLHSPVTYLTPLTQSWSANRVRSNYQ
jgi:diacylglycerol kinase family enzyme